MKADPIRNMRNRFWLLLSGSFTVIFLFAMVAIYVGNSMFIHQQIQNQFGSFGQVQRILEHGPNPSQFLIQTTWGTETTTHELLAPFHLSEGDVAHLSEKAMAILRPAVPRERGFFDFGIVRPLFEVDGRTWFATFEEGSENIGYLLFSNVGWILAELPMLRQNLLVIGSIGTALFIGISYFLANAFTKPSLRAFERQKQFIADASHELKTPLQIIKGSHRIIIANKDKPVSSQQKWLNNIEFSTSRMTHLTADLLRLASLENQVPKSDFDWGKTCQTTLQPLKQAMKEKNIQLSSSLDSGIILHQNEEKIIQLMVILLDNAIKYTPENGWIEITLSRYKRHASLSVKNSGPGLDDSQIKKVFERFYRADTTRNSKDQSFGLGLAIAKGIVEQGGGRISATSVPGVETCFAVSFSLRNR